MRIYQNSGLNLISYVLTIILLLFFTVISFALIYFGISRVNPSVFNAPNPIFFNFLYFSFNNLLFNSISEVSARLPLTQGVLMVQQLFSFFLGVIFVSIILSVRNQRYSEELTSVINSIEKEGAAMESFIKDEYKVNSIEAAMVELEKLKASFFKLIYQLTNYIK